MNAISSCSQRVLLSSLFLGLACQPKSPTATPAATAPTSAPATSAKKAYPEPPPPSAPRPVNFPDVASFNSDKNGLQVYVVENHEVPLVDVQIIVKAGAIDGLVAAELTADMLMQGTKKHNKAKLDEAFTLLGARLIVYAGLHETVLATRVMSKDVPAALSLLDEVLRMPSFEAAALEKVRAQYIMELSRARAEQDVLADALFAQVAYPAGHPYGHHLATDEEIAAINLDVIKNFHDVYFRANNASLLLAGDITQAQAQPLVAKVLGQWKFARDEDLPPNPLKAFSVAQFQEVLPTNYQVHMIDLPTASTQIVFGNLAMSRMDPNWAKFQVVNRILGANSSSRLFTDLRENQKLTYGIYSSVDMAQSLGTFQITTQTTVVDEMLKGIFAHTKRLRDEVPDEKEFATAQRALVQQFPLELESASQIAAKVSQQLTFHLPNGYWQSYRDQLAAVTAQEVPSLASQYIFPVPVIVMVGPAAQIEPALKKVRELAKATVIRYDKGLNRL